jgi:TfoX-like protein
VAISRHPNDGRVAGLTAHARYCGVAYDEELASRIRALVAGESGASERKMFGGLAFLINGNMSVAASGEGGLMVRVDPDAGRDLVESSGAVPVVMRGRPMQGWLLLDARDVRADAELARWVGIGVAYARSLPAKG